MLTPGWAHGPVYKTAHGPMIEHHLRNAIAGDNAGLDNVLKDLNVDAAIRERWFAYMAANPTFAVDFFLEQLEAMTASDSEDMSVNTASDSDNEEPAGDVGPHAMRNLSDEEPDSSSNCMSHEEPVNNGEDNLDEEPGFEENLRAAEQRAMGDYFVENEKSSEEDAAVDDRYNETEEKAISDSDFQDVVPNAASEAPVALPEAPGASDIRRGLFNCKLSSGPVRVSSDSE